MALGADACASGGSSSPTLRSHPEWIAEWTPDKGRYVWFEGSEREKRELRRALKYAPQPYPKRGRLHATSSVKAQQDDVAVALAAPPHALRRSRTATLLSLLLRTPDCAWALALA